MEEYRDAFRAEACSTAGAVRDVSPDTNKSAVDRDGVALVGMASECNCKSWQRVARSEPASLNSLDGPG